MISSGQKRLNRDDVQKGTRNFILSFIILCGMAFCAVFLFFKSAELQKKEIHDDLEAYRSMLGRNEVLNIKLDTIYYKMTQMSNEKTQNDIFLRNSIIEDIQVGRDIIGKDSAADLRQISKLLAQLQPMLTYKNELLKKKMEESSYARLLRQCIESNTRAEAVVRNNTKIPGKLFNKK